MSEPLNWVMASSQVTGVDDGSGEEIDLVVSRSSDGTWSWIARRERRNMFPVTLGEGAGYPFPISARAAAEYWLEVTREQNGIRAALEAEAQS